MRRMPGGDGEGGMTTHRMDMAGPDGPREPELLDHDA